VADINGDGFNDVCISSSGDANIEGRVACIYGRSGGYSSRGYNFGSLKGNVGFQIIGAYKQVLLVNPSVHALCATM
jgi:hypothetical protein